MGGNKGKLRKGSVGTLAKKKKKAKRPRDKPKELEPCYLCGNKVDRHEYYCGGCDQVICEKCDETEAIGDHDPIEHQKPEADYS